MSAHGSQGKDGGSKQTGQPIRRVSHFLDHPPKDTEGGLDTKRAKVSELPVYLIVVSPDASVGFNVITAMRSGIWEQSWAVLRTWCPADRHSPAV